MKKTAIINIPMTQNAQKIVYVSNDSSLPASTRAVGYPIISFLERTLQAEDELGILFLAKQSKYSMCDQHMEELKKQMAEVNEQIGATISYDVIYSEFSEDKNVHEQLMQAIVEKLEENSIIIADITYGPKDLPIVVFTALNFAERFLNCTIEHIIYGQGTFNQEGRIVETQICDLSPLYSLNTLMNTFKCNDPSQAKKMLNTVISI